MLSTAPEQYHHKSHKQNQYTLRRQARNLRAKIKAFLPIQPCHKFSNRNKNILQIKNNKQIWESLYNNRNWKYCPMVDHEHNQFYYEKPINLNRSQRFEKLSKEQIQQIKEDKLYYLGEQNLKDFQRYLREERKNKIKRSNTSENREFRKFRNIERENKQIPSESSCREIDMDDVDESIFQLKDPNLPNFSKKASNNSNLKNQSNKMIQSARGKHIQLAERKKIIEFQEKSRITTFKVKLNMRLERAENNLREMSLKNYDKLDQKRHNQEMKLKKILSKRENILHKPQIKKIEEELRRTCLTKFSRRKYHERYY